MDNPNAIAEAKSPVYALNERKKYWESVKNVETARKAQAEEERKRKEAENLPTTIFLSGIGRRTSDS